MDWFLLVIAGCAEAGFAILLKQSHHFTRLWPMTFGCHSLRCSPGWMRRSSLKAA